MKTVIIDYGIGNILSLKRAIQKTEENIIVSDDLNIIDKASHLILPGVGAFNAAILLLKKKNLYNYLKNLKEDKKILGICLGMQILFSNSDEGGILTEGLNLIEGSVRKIFVKNKKYKVPNVGWRKFYSYVNDPLLNNIPDSYYYFVHSYYINSKDVNSFLISEIKYDHLFISAIVKKNNIYGCQFHPEKSGDAGLKIINNFLKL